MTFLPVTLKQNQIGAEYQGTIHNRFLACVLPDQRVIQIFDFSNISSELIAGKEYELVISPTLLTNLTISNSHNAKPTAEIWTGKIINTNWQSANDNFTYSTNEILQDQLTRWVLLNLDVGTVIVKSGELMKQSGQLPQQGDILSWDFCRWDLYAVV